MEFLPSQIDDRFRFALVGHTQELARAVERCADPKIEDVIIKVVGMGEAVPAAQALFDQGVEVVLGHMGSSRLMRQATERLVVNIPRSRLDLIVAFQQAMQFDTTVGLTTFARPTDGMEVIEALLGIRVHQVVFHAFEEMRPALTQAFADGVRVFVGGGVSRRIVQELGGRHVVPVPRPSVVEEALREARSLAYIRRRQLESEARVRTIIHEIDDGVVGIDPNGRIDILNKAAQRVFDVGERPASRKVQAAIARKTRLHEVLAQGTPVLDDILEIQQTKVILRTLPIQIDGKNRGAVALLKEVSRVENLNRKVRESLYRKGFVAKHTPADIKGRSAALREVLDRAEAFARTDATVFIQGETGVGKELLAQSVHNLSPRRMAPFVALNCAALPEQLLESELFGYEEGAFTGARRGGKIGLFEMAHSGTIFLDEIGDIPKPLQVRLLRVLESKEVMRVGGDKYVPVDVRILSASHRDLQQEVLAGRFRPDLYYRLTVLRLMMPPLRRRFEDLEALVAPLLARYEQGPETITTAMYDRMRAYSWPGNIRELTSLLESYLILLGGRAVDPALFFSLMDEIEAAGMPIPCEPAIQTPAKAPADLPTAEPVCLCGSLKEMVEGYERQIIAQALKEARYSRAEAARRLGISTNTLWRKYIRKGGEDSDPPGA